MSRDDKIFTKARLTRKVMGQQETTTDKVLAAVTIAPIAAVLDVPETLASGGEDLCDAICDWFEFDF